MSPVPITGAVSQKILMSVMIVFAGCVNSPIAGLSPAVVLTVTPVAKPTCLMYLSVTMPVEAILATSVIAPVVASVRCGMHLSGIVVLYSRKRKGATSAPFFV